jgi:hypothetical protein
MGKFGAVKGPGRAVISARSSREGSAGPGNPGERFKPRLQIGIRAVAKSAGFENLILQIWMP